MLKRIWLASVSSLWTASLLVGCIGVSQKPSAGAASSGTAPSTAVASSSATSVCPNGTVPADDGLIDDLEDGDGRLLEVAGRDGYWWTSHDANGSVIGPSPFKPEDGGATGGGKAMHATGNTVGGEGAWGVNFGANFVSQGIVYDASQYAGVSFKAKAAPNTTHKVRFKIGDINTHKDGGVCTTSCWNHFGENLTLTDEWKEYTVPFASTRQEPGWGNPRPPSLTTSKLVSLDWSIGPGGPFDIWVDEIQFFKCK